MVHAYQLIAVEKRNGSKVYVCDLCGDEFALYRKCFHHVELCMKEMSGDDI